MEQEEILILVKRNKFQPSQFKEISLSVKKVKKETSLSVIQKIDISTKEKIYMATQIPWQEAMKKIIDQNRKKMLMLKRQEGCSFFQIKEIDKENGLEKRDIENIQENIFMCPIHQDDFQDYSSVDSNHEDYSGNDYPDTPSDSQNSQNRKNSSNFSENIESMDSDEHVNQHLKNLYVSLKRDKIESDEDSPLIKDYCFQDQTLY